MRIDELFWCTRNIYLFRDYKSSGPISRWLTTMSKNSVKIRPTTPTFLQSVNLAKILVLDGAMGRNMPIVICYYDNNWHTM